MVSSDMSRETPKSQILAVSSSPPVAAFTTADTYSQPSKHFRRAASMQSRDVQCAMLDRRMEMGVLERERSASSFRST
eukprot:2546104-Pleurochrysis_carterae.AAC.2